MNTTTKNTIISLAFTAVIGLLLLASNNKKESYTDCEVDNNDMKKYYPNAFQRGILASGTVFANPNQYSGLGWL